MYIVQFGIVKIPERSILPAPQMFFLKADNLCVMEMMVNVFQALKSI